MIAKYVALLSLFVLIMLVHIGTMIYGWGLTPRSWWWIIGASIFGRSMLGVIEKLVKEEK